MFCPHCGTEATSELNYCKRCGGNLSLPMQAEASRPAISPGLALAIGGTTFLIVIFGLIVTLVALTEMSRGREFLGALVAIGVAGGITILGSVFMLMRLWRRVLGGNSRTIGSTRKESKPAAFSKQASAPELGPARVSALPHAHVSSVTEHTTRTFDPVYREPRK